MRIEDLLTQKRFRITRNVSGFPCVIGDIAGPDGWDTVYVWSDFQICDPNISTGP